MAATSGRTARVLCCKCGISIVPNEANTCITCLSAEIDITKHIERQNTIVACPKCDSYLNPPNKWIHATPESPELLALCIKRVRGLNKGLSVRGARFIWTEPHSKRINIEVTVRGELPTGDMVEQELPLEFVVHSQQCHDCTRSAAKDYWNAVVQVRQKVDHKRTLLSLEQIILRKKAHSECSNIKQVTGGIDFFFNTRSQAMSFVNFLFKHVPCRSQTSQHLKSHDVHNNTYNYKYTFSVEVAGVCKNDIVCLSKAQSQRLGGIGPLCIVSKVAEAIHLIDPVTCQISLLDGPAFFASPFTAIASQKQLTAFVVVEIEDGGPDTKKHIPGARISRRHRPVSLWLMRMNPSATHHEDEVHDDGMIHCRCHLGHIIQVGDTVYGLDIRNCNINHPEFEHLSEHQIPDVILVHRPPQPSDADLSVGSSRPSKPKRRRKNSVATTDLISTTSEVTNALLDECTSDEEFFDAEDMVVDDFDTGVADQ